MNITFSGDPVTYLSHISLGYVTGQMDSTLVPARSHHYELDPELTLILRTEWLRAYAAWTDKSGGYPNIRTIPVSD